MRFNLLAEEAAQIGGDGLGPGAAVQLRDGGAEDFVGEGAGFGGNFPGIPQVKSSPAGLAIKPGAEAGEEGALGVFGIFEPVTAIEAGVEFGGGCRRGGRSRG